MTTISQFKEELLKEYKNNKSEKQEIENEEINEQYFLTLIYNYINIIYSKELYFHCNEIIDGLIVDDIFSNFIDPNKQFSQQLIFFLH